MSHAPPILKWVPFVFAAMTGLVPVSRDLECRTIQVRRFETTAVPSFQPAKVELHMVPSAALRFFSNSHSPKPHRCVSRTGACNLFQWYLHRKPSRVIFRHGPSILHVSPLCRSLELALLLSTLSTSSFSLYRRSSSLASLFRLGSFPRMHRNGSPLGSLLPCSALKESPTLSRGTSARGYRLGCTPWRDVHKLRAEHRQSGRYNEREDSLHGYCQGPYSLRQLRAFEVSA